VKWRKPDRRQRSRITNSKFPYFFLSGFFNLITFRSLSEMMLNLLENSLLLVFGLRCAIYPTNTTSSFVLGQTAFIAISRTRGALPSLPRLPWSTFKNLSITPTLSMPKSSNTLSLSLPLPPPPSHMLLILQSPMIRKHLDTSTPAVTAPSN
jgi:hypothetical protein